MTTIDNLQDADGTLEEQKNNMDNNLSKYFNCIEDKIKEI